MKSRAKACRAVTACAALMTLITGLSTSIARSADSAKFPFGCVVREGYVNVTGGKVWYQIVGTGDAPPLITLHGGPGFTHDYLEPLGALCKERPVVFYDQLGAGKAQAVGDSYDNARYSRWDRSGWRVDKRRGFHPETVAR